MSLYWNGFEWIGSRRLKDPVPCNGCGELVPVRRRADIPTASCSECGEMARLLRCAGGAGGRSTELWAKARETQHVELFVRSISEGLDAASRLSERARRAKAKGLHAIASKASADALKWSEWAERALTKVLPLLTQQRKDLALVMQVDVEPPDPEMLSGPTGRLSLVTKGDAP